MHQGDISPAEAYQRLQNNPSAVLVDVRTQPEWVFVGVPAVLGAKGVERIVTFKMNEDEQKSMNESISHVKDLIGATVKLFPELA